MSDRGVSHLIGSLRLEIGVANELLEKLGEFAENWDSKYTNSLPNSAFAVVEKGYSEGKDKGGRHLPHHSKGVKSSVENSSVDLAHYRNALARVNQIKSVFGKESDSALRKKAASHLEKHRSVLNISKSCFNQVEIAIWEECEKLFIKNVEPLLSCNESEEVNNG